MHGKLRPKSKSAREVELLARLATYEAALREIAGINEKHVAPAVLAKRIARKALDTP